MRLPRRSAACLASLKEDILRISAKEVNVEEVLEAVVCQIPSPKGDPDAPLRALIFDLHYDL